MNAVIINKKRYKYPASLNDMSAKQGIELATIAHEKPEEGADEAEIMTWIVDYLSCLCNAPKKILQKLDVQTGLSVIEGVEAMMTYEPKQRNHITVKGRKYYFPRADQEPLKDTTFGEWMDANNLNKNIDEAKGGNYDALLKVMAVYCRPMIVKRIRRWFRKDIEREEIQPYTGANWDIRYNLFKNHCTMADVMDFGFFLNAQLITSMRYLASSAVDEVQHMAERLEDDTDGTED